MSLFTCQLFAKAQMAYLMGEYPGFTSWNVTYKPIKTSIKKLSRASQKGF